jgi:hypothetical protein
VGELTLQEVPKLREGSSFPSFLDPRRKAEKALLSVVHAACHADAYVEGVSTRKVDSLLQSLGLTGIDKSQVMRHGMPTHLQGLGRSGADLPRAAVGGGLPLRVAGRHLPEGASEPPRREHGGGGTVPNAP